MKVPTKPLVLSFCVLGLAACASQQETAAYVEPAAVGGQPAAANPAPIVTDDAYMAKVERIALRRGIDVHWVNVPTKRVKQD